MRKLWLIFAQAVTLALAVYFVFGLVKPPLPATLPTGLTAGEPASLDPTHAPSDGYRAAVRRSLPSVVHILTTQKTRPTRSPFLDDPILRYFFGERETTPRKNAGLGSGVIVADHGIILTNAHVVDSADEIEVLLNDGRRFPATVVGADPESDLAVLRIKAEKLAVIPFGDMRQVEVGDVVLAIGNPFGVGQTVTMGIVSALGRSHLGINAFENFIQTDAAINPGNSGGALVNGQGRLIGINTAIYSQSGGSLGIGFAIPISSARNILEQILKNGDVVRGWIGVEVQDMSPDMANSFGLPDNKGALLAGILRGGPADQAGIRPGDIVQAVNGRPINTPQELLDQVSSLKPGDTGQFRIFRQGQAKELVVSIGKRPRVGGRERR